MDIVMPYLGMCAVVALAYFIAKAFVERSHRATLYRWAPYNMPYERSGDPIHAAPAFWLLRGAQEEAKRLGKQGVRCGLADAPAAIEGFLHAHETEEGDMSASNQFLTEVLEEAHKFAVILKDEGLDENCDAIRVWRADVSLWADIVSHLAPKLAREAGMLTAPA